VNRRGFLGLVGAAIAGFLATTSRRRYGPVTIERHQQLRRQGIHLHTFHQGRDVTCRCRFADDTGNGVADLLLHNAAGKPYWDPRTRTAAHEIVTGVTMRAV
jgi:hypothetical protein